MADHRFVAATYDWILAASEARGLTARRRALVGTAAGRVLEVGAGTGLNLRHYRPDQVKSIVALEPDGAMRRRLAGRAARSSVPLRVQASTIGEAAFAPASFDTIVATLVLCSVDDPERAAEALHRWLVPGGRLLFIEHVRAFGALALLQRAVTPAWARAAAGCRLDRDTLSTMRRAGLVVTDCERFALPAAGPLFRSSVQGVAWRRPIELDSWQ